jgi:hypothetical protein
MENINTFQEGMNKDLSKSVFKAGTYINAENLSLVTDVGLSTGTLRNIKGNEWFIDIPSCSNVVQISSIINTANPVSITVTTAAGTFTSGPYTVSNLSQLGAALQADSQFTNRNLAVAYTSTNIVIYGTLVNNLLVNSNISVIAINAIVNNSYIPFVSLPKIMGWGMIRDQIIIFTTENSDETPVNKVGQIWKLVYDKHTDIPVITLLHNGYLNFSLFHPIPNPGGVVGNYETPDIQKIYWTDNYNVPRVLNITDPNAMAFVSEEFQVTSNLSKVVATVSAILAGGDIKTGIYQVSARLTKTTGASSNYVVPSNPIPVISELEGSATNYENYEARDAAASAKKSIVGKLFNLDLEYDRVEPIIIYRETATSSPDIFILPSEPVPSNGVYQFTYSGNVTTIPVSLEEFLADQVNFDTVKSLVSKNNMLFFGNVKYSDFDVDFDARAYRFTGANNGRTANLTGSSSYIINGIAPNWSIPTDADAIQNLAAQAPDAPSFHLYQADGVTFGGQGPNVTYEFIKMNSFNDVSAAAPYRTPLDNSKLGGPFGLPTIHRAPYAYVKPTSSVTSLNFDPTLLYDNVNQGFAYGNSSSPFVNYGLKGYMRDEMYRFGIVFFSKRGEPSYVHWVADIRMPKVFMPDYTNSSGNRSLLAFPITSMDDGTTNTTNDFSTLTGSKRDYYGNNLGIKFTVDVTSIRDQISGYSIVRVPRTDNDKTILGQGILNPVMYSNTSDATYYTTPSRFFWSQESSTPGNGVNSTTYMANNIATLASPEFLFDSVPGYVTNDQIDIIQTNQATLFGATSDGTATSANGVFLKQFTHYLPANAPKSLGTPVAISATIPMSSPNVNYTTYSFPATITSASIRNKQYVSLNQSFGGVGGSRLAVGIAGGSFNFDTIATSINAGWSWSGSTFLDSNTSLLVKDGISSSIANIYIANYRRPTTIQYGGNTYSQRSYNEYISTGHVQLVDSTTTVNTSMVFGGDTFVTLFDYADQLRDAANFGISTYYNTKNVINLTAVECSFPIEWRKQNAKPAGAIDDGYTTTVRCSPNKSLTYSDYPSYITGGSGPYTTAEWTENFDVETSYVSDNDVVKFFPKPDPFVSQSVFDVRVHRSQIKTNGELSDSWGVFKSEDYIDVDTSQGELNNLMLYQNTLIGFQNKGVVQLSVKERAISPDVSGSEIILGTGGILENYTYISKIIGSRHQLGFTSSHDSIFWFDMNTKNMYKMSGASPVAITVAKGMAAFMNNNLDGIIQTSDNPYLDRGITATYDFRYNEAIMTFKDTVKNQTTTFSGAVTSNPSTGTYTINTVNLTGWATPGSTIVAYVNNGTTPYTGTITSIIPPGTVTIQFNTNPSISIGSTLTVYSYTTRSFTVAYNDFIDGYTSFYSYTPTVYINDQTSIFSPNYSTNESKIYRHDIGRHGVFYVDYINNPLVTYTPAKSTLKLIVNPYPTETKVFDNYEMITEVIDLTTGANIVDDTFDRIRLYDDYQNSDFQSLPIDNSKDTAKRKERTWNISNLRNRVLYNSSTSPNVFSTSELSTYTIVSPQTALGDKVFGERMRDKYLIVDLEYDNLNDRRLILHTFKTNYRKSAR